jgi:hypothetical protein
MGRPGRSTPLPWHLDFTGRVAPVRHSAALRASSARGGTLSDLPAVARLPSGLPPVGLDFDGVEELGLANDHARLLR